MAYYKKNTEDRDYQQELTDNIIKRIEKAKSYSENGLSWDKPFFSNTELPFNYLTGEKYHGSNIIALWSADFTDPRWMTYVQIQEFIKKTKQIIYLEKGSKASYITKVIPIYKKDKDGNIEKDQDGNYKQVIDETGTQKIGFRFYPLFNCSQIKGIEPYFKPDPLFKPNEEVNMLLEAMEHKTGLQLEHHQKGSAYYVPSLHKIYMPDKQLFKKIDYYYDTLLHEMGHSTGKALNRDMTGSFGSESYAKEELTAELTSTFMAVELGLEHNPSRHENHAAYLNSWLKALKEDKTYIYKAANHASKATEYQMDILNEHKLSIISIKNKVKEIELQMNKIENKINYKQFKLL